MIGEIIDKAYRFERKAKFSNEFHKTLKASNQAEIFLKIFYTR